MTPDIVIDSAPYATVAETLQGIAPSGFLQPNLPQNLSQTTLTQLTSGGDASSLHNHDSLYAKLVGGSLSLGSNTYLNLGGHASNPALGPSDVGKIWFNSTNDVIKYYDGTTIQTLSTASNSSYSTLGVGGTLSSNTQLESTITNPANVGMLIQGASGQTANLWNATNSSGTSLSSLNPSGTLSAVAFSGNGSSLSNLNASNLSSGTVPLSVLPQATTSTSGYLSSTDWNTFNSGVNTLNSATSANLTSKIVKRDTSGNFTAGAITAATTLGVGGSVGANTQLQVTATSASNVGLAIQGSASQSADFLEIKNISGTALISVTSSGYVGIGTTNPQAALDVEVSGPSQTITGFGELNASGTIGYYSGGGPVTPSIQTSNQILSSGEIDVVSDRRVKEEIVNIDPQKAMKFLNEAKPVFFRWKKNKNYSFGFIAQDLLKMGFAPLVQIDPDEKMEKTVEEDGFISPYLS
jgi:hypothetical protein